MTPELASSPKAVTAAAIYTGVTGFAAWFELIQGGLAILSLIIGIIAAVVIVRMNLQRMRLDREAARDLQRKNAAEIEQIKLETRIMRDQAHQHSRQG